MNLEDIAQRIVWEDNHLLFFNKRAGELVQRDKMANLSLEEDIKAFLKQRDKKSGNVYLGVPHRLDRPVSGVVLFCKTSKALTRINEMLQKKEITKTYWAIVEGKPPKERDTLIHFLVRNQQSNKTRVYKEKVPNAKCAVLHYTLKKVFDRYSWLEIILETGRHHQIRAQLAAVGMPIRGDVKYGARRPNRDASISLHAWKISLDHPVKHEKLEVEVLPLSSDNLWRLCSV